MRHLRKRDVRENTPQVVIGDFDKKPSVSYLDDAPLDAVVENVELPKAVQVEDINDSPLQQSAEQETVKEPVEDINDRPLEILDENTL